MFLMLVDHALIAADTLGFGSDALTLARLTITRPAMPLFMLLTGAMWAQHLPRKRRIMGVIAVSAALNTYLAVAWPAYPLPEILVLWAAAALCAKRVVSAPIAWIVLGYVQWMYWPIGWGGYQPGSVVVFAAVGVLWGARIDRGVHSPARSHEPVSTLTGTRPAKRLGMILAAVGRRPLAWYAAHLVVIGGVVAVCG